MPSCVAVFRLSNLHPNSAGIKPPNQTQCTEKPVGMVSSWEEKTKPSQAVPPAGGGRASHQPSGSKASATHPYLPKEPPGWRQSTALLPPPSYWYHKGRGKIQSPFFLILQQDKKHTLLRYFVPDSLATNPVCLYHFHRDVSIAAETALWKLVPCFAFYCAIPLDAACPHQAKLLGKMQEGWGMQGDLHPEKLHFSLPA